MFLRFTKKFSGPKFGLPIALLLLFAPALIVTAAAAGAPQKNKAKPTPAKKTQAKTKPTPKPDPRGKSKTNSKNSKETASKNKSADKRDKRNEKTAAKNDRRANDRDKNSRSASRNSKQNLAANSRIPSKSSKTDRNSRTNDRNARNNEKNKSSSSRNARLAADKNDRRSNASRNAKPALAKTPPRRSSRRTGERNSRQPDSITIVEKTADKTVDRTPATSNRAELPEIIVTGFSVPVRSQAKADAAPLSNVRLGTVLKVTEKNPAWYKVQYADGGKTSVGWISANSVNDLNAAGKTEIYRQIVERNYRPQMDFESAAEFYEFVRGVDGELDSSDKSAEIELKQLLALRSALKTIPADRRETAPYRDFLKTREKEIVYNEPAGEWLVVSNEFWDLHNKYRKSGVSDAIAWEAANNPLPGECEGYVNCYLFDMRMRFGEYLNLHPNGARAGEALRSMTDYLSPIVADAPQKTVYNGPTDVTDRAEFNNLIAELRTIVARLQFVEKEKTLQQLRQIAEAYR